MKHATNFLFATLFFGLHTIFAQTGPGGVGNASTNILWLDAGQLTGLNNNDPISTWTDVSGNGNNALQASGINQPLYIASVPAVNNKPVVRFDGSNDYFLLTNHVSNTALSVFSVVERTAPYTWRFLWSTRYFNMISQYGGNSWGYYNGTSTQLRGVLNPGTYEVTSTIVNSGTSKLVLGQNGSYATKTYYPSGNRIVTSIGCHTDGVGTPKMFHGGNVAEMIMYNYDLSQAERFIVENYIASKYNRGCAVDLYYLDNTHPHEVAGIGSSGIGPNTDARGTGQVQINNASSLDASDYLLFGHNNLAMTVNSADVPGGYTGARWNRTWRADVTGSPGTVDVRFYLGSNPISTNTATYDLFIESSNGVFNDGGVTTISAGTYDVGTNSVLFSGVTLPDNCYFTLANSSFQLQTVQSGNWNDPATWNCSCVPDSTMKPFILSGHTVTVSATQSSSSLTINSGGILTFSGTNSLRLKNNLSIAGTLTAATGNVHFTGTSPQNIYNTSGTRQDFYTLTLTSSTVTLSSGSIGITDALTVNTGQLHNGSLGGSIVLVSDASKTARLATSGATNPFNGQYTIQRYISTRNADYSDWSSPVSTSTINDWDLDIYMSGVGGNDGNAQDGFGNIWYSVWVYNSIVQKYDSIFSTSRALNPAEGFELYLGDDQFTFNAKTVDTKGIPNYGNISANSYLSSGNGAFSLIGNPYASWIDWDLVTKSNVANEVWIYNNQVGTYQLYSTPPIEIPATQGFWVESTGASPSVTFTEASKTTSNSSSFIKKKMYGENEFVLQLSTPIAPLKGLTYFRLMEDATGAYETADAKQLVNHNKNALLVCSKSNENIALGLNAFSPYNNEISIPVEVKVPESGTYSFELLGHENITPFYSCIMLKNMQNGELTDLNATPQFSFQASNVNTVQHFELLLSNNSDACRTSSVAENNSVTFTPAENTVVVTTDFVNDENVYISITNLLGQEISPAKAVNTSAKYHTITTEGLSGVYIITVKSSTGLHSQKMVLY